MGKTKVSLQKKIKRKKEGKKEVKKRKKKKGKREKRNAGYCGPTESVGASWNWEF